MPAISAESVRRTDLIQAQVRREEARTGLTREEFLVSLDLAADIHCVRDPDDQRFARAFELINKTNQFNTTGRRWSQADAISYLADGGAWWTFTVADRFTRYGLVGVVCLSAGCVDQFVMSCRVAGLDLEHAVLSAILPLADPHRSVFAGHIRATDSNAVVQNLFERIGWTRQGDVWTGGVPALRADHIRLRVADMPEAAI